MLTPKASLPPQRLNRRAGTGSRLIAIRSVLKLPRKPEPEGHYAFGGIPRNEVTDLNHNLHKYPAKFIPQLPAWALRYPREEPSKHETVLDPFCGSGTTLLEAGLLGHHCIGYDINPLAVLISRAKTALLSKLDIIPEQIIDVLIRRASKNVERIRGQLVAGSECMGLHRTWSFWFRPREMARLLAIRDTIIGRYQETNSELATFLLACLSSVAKASSFLNEDQIKVRYDPHKKPADPFESFPSFTVLALHNQIRLSRLLRRAGAKFLVINGSATDLQLKTASIDRVVTSPPYINAVDYTMTHKYNFFLLGLVRAEEFKSHCREYIGMTERAVRAADLVEMPRAGINVVDEIVEDLWSIGTPVSHNRAFIVSQYFQGMYAAFKELRRVVRSGGRVIMVIGDNRVCGRQIKTAAIVEQLAHMNGFRTELRFYHHLANRSSMRLNRAITGGKVDFETIYVYRRP